MEKEKIKGIIIENDNNILSKYKSAFDDSFDIITFTDTESSLKYIIENNLDINFYIIKWSLDNKDVINLFSNKIYEINPQIKLIIIDTDSDFNDDEYPNALAFLKNVDVSFVVKSILTFLEESQNDGAKRRQYTRINWPLNVIIQYKDRIMGTIDRNMLSISGNGAYISSDTNIPEKGDMLGLTISFKDFKLFTEAKVVWINNDNNSDLPKGFAVQFVDIGQASQKIIDQIIKDKLLQDILVKFKDENFFS